MSLTNQVALVTGAGQGIGKAAALALAEKVRAAVAAIRAEQPAAILVAVPVADPEICAMLAGIASTLTSLSAPFEPDVRASDHAHHHGHDHHHHDHGHDHDHHGHGHDHDHDHDHGKS